MALTPIEELQMYVAKHSWRFLGTEDDALRAKFNRMVDVSFGVIGVDHEVSADELRKLTAAARDGYRGELEPLDREADYLQMSGWIGDHWLGLQFMAVAQEAGLGKVANRKNAVQLAETDIRVYSTQHLPIFLPNKP